ncbi:stage II sporulation protein R [Clostridium sp. MB40-C1]|uniref:stage II sporulation protein R n=1 Tax=Clostridium sp. MB40-C1 TaxID=3070996 RepID=UPI0027E010F6|nr:stage II sporulation protein R [Clostridium sp. MB40-C1]WMJ79699.1 stage II sporulation protein R [Clostridium sp. MB40-C1]
MKNKFVAIILVSILLCVSVLWVVFSKNNTSQEEISKKLIRFHVLANSDTTEDQALKLKIRDEVLEYIYPKLKNSKNIEESRDIIKQRDQEIKKIAEKVIRQKGYNYNVVTMLSRENFPVKSYGNITLPQGNYEAYRIIIGKGEGHNWWCVMFPPLCFTDITKGEVAYEKTERDMKQVLTPEEYKFVNNSNKEANNLVVKFKMIEVLKNICKKSK